MNEAEVKGQTRLHRKLLRYLDAQETGRAGWVPEYEGAVSPERNYAYLSGHYSLLLDDLIRLIGPGNVRELIFNEQATLATKLRIMQGDKARSEGEEVTP